MKDLGMTPSSGWNFWDWLVNLFSGGNDNSNSSNNSVWYNAGTGESDLGFPGSGIDEHTLGIDILYGDVGTQAAQAVTAERRSRTPGFSAGGTLEVADPNEDINPILSNNTSANDASVYGNLIDGSVEEKLGWLIQNDPENSQGWLESLLGLQASRENTQQARDYEKEFYGQRAQMLMKDLEAAGLNPILAAQYVGGSSSVGTAGVPDYNVSTNATSRYITKLDNAVANNKTLAGIITALIAAVGLAAKGYISKR